MMGQFMMVSIFRKSWTKMQNKKMQYMFQVIARKIFVNDNWVKLIPFLIKMLPQGEWVDRRICSCEIKSSFDNLRSFKTLFGLLWPFLDQVFFFEKIQWCMSEHPKQIIYFLDGTLWGKQAFVLKCDGNDKLLHVLRK